MTTPRAEERRRRGLWSRFVRSDRGAAIVEMALVAPLLIMLVFGVVEFGRMYNAQVTVTHAAREGVRVLAVTGDAGQAAIAARNAATSIDAGAISVASDPCVPGEPTELQVTYPFSFEVPLFGSGSINLTGTGVMRCGG